ncbi:MAG: hypothetical protein H6730_05785 [Deltaproteobacteria bacterium]|nr:hypothetical protein [Deltaproteobacteria bacterium]
MTQDVNTGAARGVIRRRPAVAATPAPEVAPEAPPTRGVVRLKAGERQARRGKVLDINPKLQSTKGILPKAEGQTAGARPMSVAEKQRAAAEAAFRQIAPAWTDNTPPVPEEEKKPYRSEFEIRVSQRDQITTGLRMSEDRKQALAYARELVDNKWGLPPDQSVLVKVINLGDDKLSKLALEELLELDDRGRVRPNESLLAAIRGVKSTDRDIRYLQELFIEKLGVRRIEQG